MMRESNQTSSTRIYTCHATLPTSILQMRTRAPEETLPYISLTQKQLYILLRPVPRRERLKEHHDLLIHSQRSS